MENTPLTPEQVIEKFEAKIAEKTNGFASSNDVETLKSELDLKLIFNLPSFAFRTNIVTDASSIELSIISTGSFSIKGLFFWSLYATAIPSFS